MNIDDLKPNQLWKEGNYYATHEDIYIYTLAEIKHQGDIFSHVWWGNRT